MAVLRFSRILTAILVSVFTVLDAKVWANPSSPERGSYEPIIPYDCPGTHAYRLWDNHHSVWTCQKCPTGQVLVSDRLDGNGRRISIKCSPDCPSGQLPTEIVQGRASCDCPTGMTGEHCDRECDSIELSFLDNGYVEIDGGTSLSGQADTELILPRNLTGIAPWLENDFINANNRCQAESAWLSQTHWRTNAQNETLGFGYMLAGCVARLFNVPYFGQDNYYGPVLHGEGNPNLDPPTSGRYQNQAVCQHSATLDYPWTWYASFFPDPQIDLAQPIKVCEQSVRYFDMDGNPLSEGVGVVCSASMLVHYSPISLLWNGSSLLSPEISIGYFRIDPSIKEGDGVVWRGSSEQPVLVFDPEHTGEVKDFKQVFGQWAFGGRVKKGLQTVSLKKKFDPKTATPWANGFEALASLDTSKNGIVDGKELEPLALWFDENKDGRSQPGEVRTLTDVGVTKLFTKSDRIGENKKDLYASEGFVRIVDGKEITGTSVDWYSDRISSMKDLTDRLTTASILTTKDSDNKKVNATEVDREYAVSMLPDLKPATQLTNFDGMWAWRSAGTPATAKPDGILVLSSNNGKLFGHSYSQYYIKNDKKRASFLSAVPLKGSLQGDTASLQIMSSRSTEVKTKVRFDEGTSTLSGDSVAQLMLGNEKLNTRYSWTATKIGGSGNKRK